METINWEEEYSKLCDSALRLHELYKDKNRRYYKLKEEHTDTITRNEDYRGRIDRTIEYIENTPKIVGSIHLKDKESNYVFIEKTIKNELLEILKGDDDLSIK